MSEDEYLERRIAEELAAAAASSHPRVAKIHLTMAEAYRSRLYRQAVVRRAA